MSPSSVDGAAQAARRAATDAGVSVRSLEVQDDLEAASRLLSEIWATGTEQVVPAHLLKAVAYSGNYVSGAFSSAALVGTSMGFLGRKHGRAHLHSHITGVAPSVQGRNVGFALKQHQRAWAMANGLNEIVWTFDPLVRRNGYFNVMKLGAEIVDYKANFYGAMGDSINEDDESDRCVVVWRTDSERATDAAEGRSAEPIVDADRASTVLSEKPDGEPEVALLRGEILLTQIPEDIVALRHEEPEKAAAWRQALREVLTWAFSQGYAVIGMTKRGEYLLSQPT